jgi:hypothetical protein
MKYGQTFADAYRQVRLRKELSEDHEVSMAVSQLKTIQDNVNQLMSALQTKGSDYELEAWVQSKITSANDKMTSAADYMKNSPSVSEAADKGIPPIDKDNAPGVKIAKIRATGSDASKVADLKTKLSKEKDSDALERQIVTLTSQIGLLKAQLENEKNKMTKPEPNPDTGEVPLRTGIASALLDKKGPKPDMDKQAKTKVELSKKKSKIEINPDVDMGVFSGGNKMNQGNLY